jgi:hypothetical protein
MDLWLDLPQLIFAAVSICVNLRFVLSSLCVFAALREIFDFLRYSLL